MFGFEIFLFCLAFSLAFFEAFQISKFAVLSKRVVGGLLMSDGIRLRGTELECQLWKLKDQKGKGYTVVLLKRVCHVSNTMLWGLHSARPSSTAQY